MTALAYILLGIAALLFAIGPALMGWFESAQGMSADEVRQDCDAREQRVSQLFDAADNAVSRLGYSGPERRTYRTLRKVA